MFLEKIFMRKYQGKEIDAQVREKYGVFASVIGIVCNVFLSASKIIVGTIAGSVAIVADGFNNLSDVSSAVVSLCGIKLSSKPADEKHPFGHGRYEYIAALVVAFLIFAVALSCFKDGFSKIINGGDLTFSWVSVALLSFSMLLKVWLSLMYRRIGKKVDSKVCLATSKDALGDVFITGAALLSMLIFKLFGLDIDGWVGCGVSIMIFISGIDVTKDTLEPLIGEAIPRDLYDLVTNKVDSYEGVAGSHDLIVHSYGPMKRMATIHAEIDSSLGIKKMHELVERIEKDTLRDLGIFLVIHMDPVNTGDEELEKVRADMAQLVAELEPGSTIHDLRLTREEGKARISFEIVVPYSLDDIGKRQLVLEIQNVIRQENKDVECIIEVENSFISTEGN